MKRSVGAGALGAAVIMCAGAIATTAMAADDPITARKTMMKNVNAATGVLVRMAKAEIEFNAISAELALRVINTASQGYGELFPDGSEDGGQTEFRAGPAIWSNRDGFNTEIAKLQNASAEALVNPPTTQEEVGPALNSVGQVCSSCHEGFRLKN
jgi:cytochrome c556